MWKDAIVNPDFTIKQAMQVIDDGAMRSAFVVDTEGMFLGVVADGDVRRAILKGVPLDGAVRLIMNTSPIVCEQGCELSESDRKLLVANHIDFVPVVNQGRLVNVISADLPIISSRKDNPIFIMAGGFGTRLRPLTDNCPKPMLKVDGKPLLERIIEHFINEGFHRFYLSTHYLPEIIREHFGDGSDWGVSINYVHEETPLGTGGSLSLLPKDIGSLPIVMMNGDVLTNLNFTKLINHHINSKAVATMCLREYEHQIPFGVISIEDGFVQEMIEKPSFRHFVNAGIYVLDHSLLNADELKGKVDMPTLLECEMGRNKKVSTYAIYEYWLDVGRHSDYEKAQNDVRLGIV